MKKDIIKLNIYVDGSNILKNEMKGESGGDITLLGILIVSDKERFISKISDNDITKIPNLHYRELKNNSALFAIDISNNITKINDKYIYRIVFIIVDNDEILTKFDKNKKKKQRERLISKRFTTFAIVDPLRQFLNKYQMISVENIYVDKDFKIDNEIFSLVKKKIDKRKLKNIIFQRKKYIEKNKRKSYTEDIDAFLIEIIDLTLGAYQNCLKNPNKKSKDTNKKELSNLLFNYFANSNKKKNKLCKIRRYPKKKKQEYTHNFEKKKIYKNKYLEKKLPKLIPYEDFRNS